MVKSCLGCKYEFGFTLVCEPCYSCSRGNNLNPNSSDKYIERNDNNEDSKQ